MNRRRAWVIGGCAAVLVLAGAAVWVWQASSIRSSPDAVPAVTSAPTQTADPQALAQQQLDEHLEECTAGDSSDDRSTGEVPEGCGIRIPWGTQFAAVDGIRFRIERLPVLELVDDVFIAGGGVLVATVSGTGQDGAPRTETYRTDDWTLRGDVSISDGEVSLDVW